MRLKTAAVLVRENQPLNAVLLFVASTPVAADIYLDGGFVGNTPFVLDVPAGEHTVKMTKVGYKTWQRKIRVQSSRVVLPAPTSRFKPTELLCRVDAKETFEP
jgi:hypothetical protein